MMVSGVQSFEGETGPCGSPEQRHPGVHRFVLNQRVALGDQNFVSGASGD